MQEAPLGDIDPRPEDEDIVQLDESQEIPGSDERLDSEYSDVRAADR